MKQIRGKVLKQIQSYQTQSEIGLARLCHTPLCLHTDPTIQYGRPHRRKKGVHLFPFSSAILATGSLLFALSVVG
jgi:hypothetical protein